MSRGEPARLPSIPAPRFGIFVSIPDLEEATQFYATLLAQSGVRTAPGRHEFDLGTEVLVLWDPRLCTSSWPTNEGTTYLTTSDPADHVRRRLVQVGVGAERRQTDRETWFERAVYLDDPWGNSLCILERGTRFRRHRLVWQYAMQAS